MSFILNSGLKIFDLINILNKSPKSRIEISKQMYEMGIIADVKAVSKYINTLKYAGFEIKQFNITKTPFKINLSEDETKGFYIFLQILIQIAEENYEREILIEKFKGNLELKDTTLPKIPHNYQKVLKNSVSLIKNAEKYLDNEISTPVCIRYKKNKIMNAIIREIKYTLNSIYFLCYDLKKSSSFYIDVNSINKIEYTNEPVFNFVREHYKTVFEIKNDLKRNYDIKQGEIITHKKDEMLVTNNFEDKKELLKRILKYKTNCEIIQPKKDIEKFLENLDELEEHFLNI